MTSFRFSGGSNKTLHYALLLSVATHSLLLFRLNSNSELRIGESGVTSKKLQIVTIQSRRPPPQDERVIPEPSRAISSVGVETKRGSLLVALDSPDSRLDAPTNGRRQAKVPDASRAESPTVAPIEKPSSVPAAEIPAGSAGDERQSTADDLRSYRVALALQARRFRVYPTGARDIGVGGRSEVEVLLLPSRAPILRLAKTSGHRELDEAALEMLRRSLENVPLPRGLIGQRLKFFLPVEFVPPP